MATFITNIKFSQQGIKDIDHTTKRSWPKCMGSE